jgi:proteasome lid subunit RPN8/RPN11
VVGDAPLRLPRAIADEIAEHARTGLPDEACGIVSGADATATRFHPAVNADASPFRYSIDSQDLLRIVTDIDDAEEDLLAIYHSHTRSPAFPSRTDVELAFWPDAAYLIVSLASDPPDLKAFCIRDGRIAGRDLQIT